MDRARRFTSTLQNPVLPAGADCGAARHIHLHGDRKRLHFRPRHNRRHYSPPTPAYCCTTPVTIKSFTGKYMNLEHIALTWVTASETNAHGFYLYRSLDDSSWTKINSSDHPGQGQGRKRAPLTTTPTSFPHRARTRRGITGWTRWTTAASAAPRRPPKSAHRKTPKIGVWAGPCGPARFILHAEPIRQFRGESPPPNLMEVIRLGKGRGVTMRWGLKEA